MQWLHISLRHLPTAGLLLLLATCEGERPARPAFPDSEAGTPGVIAITAHPEAPGARIPADFLGLGFEMPAMKDPLFSGERSFERLLANLGPGTLRFGGNSVEQTYWSPSGTGVRPDGALVLTAKDFERVFAFARRIGWRVIVALNLGVFDPDTAAAQAAWLFRRGGSALLAVEIGNEPNLYPLNGVRSPAWNYDSLRVEWNAYARAIRARVPDARIAGPATWCGDGPTWFPAFMRDEGAGLALATHHVYPMHALAPPNSPAHASVENMLSPAVMARTAACVDAASDAALARGVRLRINESNSAYGFGKRGASDVFASALWGIDHLFTLAEHGAAGVNLQTGTNLQGGLTCAGIYLPICGSAASYTARPLYFAMLFFRHAAQGRLVPLDVTTRINATAHAALADDSTLRVTVINKDGTRPVEARITPGWRYTRAGALRLTAPALEATSGVTFAGAAVAGDGRWAPKEIEPVLRQGSTFSISLPPATAVVVAFHR